MADPQPTVARIVAGDFDGHLDDLVMAILERARTGAVAFKWRLRLDGDEWSQDTVTLGEMRFAEQYCHVTDDNGRRRPAFYVELDPRTSADHAVGLIVAHLHKAQDLPLSAALKRAEAITAAELADVIGEYEVNPIPKDDSDASTTS
jgi:hypothetical protein